MKLNGKHQLLVYAGDTNLLGGNVLTVRKNTNFQSVGSCRSKCCDRCKFMSCEQNAGQYHNVIQIMHINSLKTWQIQMSGDDRNKSELHA